MALPDERISKQHALIHFRKNKFVIWDMDSMNGTCLNGKQVTDTSALVPGDQITLASFSMIFIGPDQVHSDDEIDEESQNHFSGRLETLNAIDLIQLINSTEQSGLLNLRDEKHKKAWVSCIRGEIVAASYGPIKGLDAVYSIFGLHEGEFDFVRGEQTMPAKPIEKKTPLILFEGCQLKDEDRLPGMTGELREPSRMSTQPISIPADFMT